MRLAGRVFETPVLGGWDITIRDRKGLNVPRINHTFLKNIG